MNEIFCSIFSQHQLYILTANQNARVVMIIYHAHIDWLNLCAHQTTPSVRSEFLPSVKMVQFNTVQGFTNGNNGTNIM